MSVATETRTGAAELDALQRWLDGEPADELAAELADSRRWLAALARPEAAGAMRPPVFEALLQRLIDAGERVRGQLLTTAVPLPRELYGAVHELQAQLLEVANLVEARLGTLPVDSEGAEAAADPASLAGAMHVGVRGLHLGYLLSCLSAASAAPGSWRLAHRFGQVTDDSAYRAMLALAASQPKSFSARELSWLSDLFLAEADALRPADGQPAAADWHFDASADLAPVTGGREAAQAAARPRHFSLAALLDRLRHWIAQLDERVVAGAAAGRLSECASFEAADDLPPGLAPTEMLALLRRVAARWEIVPAREHRRRRKQYEVEICVGLGARWELARGGQAPGRTSTWRVLNEDPAGYAIRSVGACAAGLEAGVVIGLREDRQRPWSVCVVRWVRSEMPEHIELGLQLLAPSFQPAQLAFRAARPHVLVPALELPAMLPVRPNPAFLVPAGSHVGRSFVFVREAVRDGQPLYLSQGRALGRDLQTSAVELFQYESDLYPD